MLGSHVGKVVSGVLLVAAAVVGIVLGLTTLVGLLGALVASLALVLAAIAVAILTRPKTAEPQSQPKHEAKAIPRTPEPEKPRESVGPPTPALEKPGESVAPKIGPIAASPDLSNPIKTTRVAPAIGRVAKVNLGAQYKPTSETPSRLGSAYLDARSKSTPPIPAKPRAFKETLLLKKRCEVEAGKLTSVKLSVAKDDYVFGKLKEVDGFEFTWAIVDLKNLGLMERHLRFMAQKGELDVPTATVEWTVPSDGPWFLAFDASKKQYVRQVAVELWQRVYEPE